MEVISAKKVECCIKWKTWKSANFCLFVYVLISIQRVFHHQQGHAFNQGTQWTILQWKKTEYDYIPNQNSFPKSCAYENKKLVNWKECA